MNKLFLVLIATAACLSCTSKGNFTINGTISKDFDGKKIYLTNRQENGVESIDSAEIKGGRFTFSRTIEKPAVYVISLGNQNNSDDQTYRTVLLCEQGKISVEMKGGKIKVGGHPVNAAYQKKIEEEKVFHKQLQALNAKYSSVNPATLSEEEIEKANDEFAAIEDGIKKLNLYFVRDNINNPLGEALFLSMVNHLSVEEMEMAIENAGNEFKSKEIGKTIINVISEMKKVSVGQKFSDLTMPDPSGKKISLSDYAGKGKYVLIDFWASWCGPCIKEMPALVEAYRLYKNENFEIVGVSLDMKADLWKAAITKNNMTWPQMSDLRQWQSEAREIYNFSSIPHTILLDPNGIIVAKDLRGKKLLETLHKLIVITKVD